MSGQTGKKKGKDGQKKKNNGIISCGISRRDAEWEQGKKKKGMYEGLSSAKDGGEDSLEGGGVNKWTDEIRIRIKREEVGMKIGAQT